MAHTTSTSCTPSGTSSGASGKDLYAAWKDALDTNRPLLDVTKALLNLTVGGERPVELVRLADAVGRTTVQTEHLVGEVSARFPWITAHTAGDLVHLDLAAAQDVRYRYHIGDRVIGVTGCGPDAIVAAIAMQQPFAVESTCPATGTPIRVEFTGQGIGQAEPADAVVGLFHPDAVPEATTLPDADTVNTAVCAQMPFFASADAARDWLTHHPGGRALPLKEGYQWLAGLLSPRR